MATTFALRPISPVIRNESFRYVTPPLAAAQDFVKGAPAFLDDGAVEEAGTNPAAILGFFTADAAQYDWKEDTLGRVTPAVPVALATGVFRGTLKGTFDPDDIGATFGITRDATTGYWYVDLAKSSSNQRVTLLGVDDEAVEDDIDVPCTFAVLPANRQVVI
jgi:hypothetical protein